MHWHAVPQRTAPDVNGPLRFFQSDSAWHVAVRCGVARWRTARRRRIPCERGDACRWMQCRIRYERIFIASSHRPTRRPRLAFELNLRQSIQESEHLKRLSRARRPIDVRRHDATPLCRVASCRAVWIGHYSSSVRCGVRVWYDHSRSASQGSWSRRTIPNNHGRRQDCGCWLQLNDVKMRPCLLGKIC